MGFKKSLRRAKKELLDREGLFGTIRRVYLHLSDLSNTEILDYYHVNSIEELAEHIRRIKQILIKRSGNYETELSEMDTCFCLDSKGDFKQLYITNTDAKRQIKHIEKTDSIKLKTYRCPYHCGWHISRV